MNFDNSNPECESLLVKFFRQKLFLSEEQELESNEATSFEKVAEQENSEHFQELQASEVVFEKAPEEEEEHVVGDYERRKKENLSRKQKSPEEIAARFYRFEIWKSYLDRFVLDDNVRSCQQ
jgi:hypothetical protein